jgi:hypothetical protein
MFAIITKTPITLSKKRRTNKFVVTKGNSICHALFIDQCPTLSKVKKSHIDATKSISPTILEESK